MWRLLFVVSVFVSGLCVTEATLRMALRGELEHSKVCYGRYPDTPAYWDTMMMLLPLEAYNNVDRMAAAFSAFRELLGRSLPICTAMTRALQLIDTRGDMGREHMAYSARLCKEQLGAAGQVRLMRTSPLLTCLGGAELAGRANLFNTAAEEQQRAHAETLAFSGQYASSFTQTIVDSVKSETLLKQQQQKPV